MAGTMLNSMSCQQQRQVTKHVCQPLGPRRNLSCVAKSLGCCNLLHARSSLKSRKVARSSIVVNSSASGSKSPSGDVASSSGSSNSYSNSDSNDPNRQRRPSPLLLTLQSLQKSCLKLVKVCWDEVTRLWGMILKERFLRLCLLLLLFPLLFNRFWGARTVNTPKEVLYSSFVTMVDQQKVQSARLETTSCRLFFELKPELEAESLDVSTHPSAEAAKIAGDAAISQADPAAAERAQPQRMYVKLADKNDQYLMQHIIKSGVDFGVVRASFSTMVAQVVATSLALWLPLIPLFFILRSMMESRRGVRPSKKSPGSYEKVVFDDVAGVDAAKEELAEVVACLKDAERYKRLKVKMPSGVLLCGPPGTGKTLLARAVAGEAGVPFIAVSASEFVEMFVGRGAARIRELFAEARKLSPCVVFIDELDAVGGIRGRGFNDERDQTLNQLLTELDGFEARPGVLLLAATNRLDVLDPALLRPGRISRKVLVPVPDEAGRRDILAVHLRNVPMASIQEKVQACERLAPLTGGFSGAELANVVNEASLLAARKQQEIITVLELLEGVQRTRFGVNGRSRRSTTPNPVMEWLARVITEPKPVKQMGSL